MTNGSERSRKGRRARQKGLEWENELIRMAKEKGVPAINLRQYRGEKTEGPDIALYALKSEGLVQRVHVALKILYLEAKCRESFSSSQILKELKERDAVAVKINRKGHFVAIRTEEYFELLEHRRKRGS